MVPLLVSGIESRKNKTNDIYCGIVPCNEGCYSTFATVERECTGEKE
jgi:hypothetical protein